MKQRFISLLSPGNGSVDVVFPDFPGCVSQGDTMDEAVSMAEEALTFHTAGMVEDGDPLPAATALEVILNDPDTEPGAVAVYVELASAGDRNF